ncbi:MAG: hypothetical protein WC791_00305 [Candidatus Paceibacterota bacterium]
MNCCLCGDAKEYLDPESEIMKVCPCVSGHPVSHDQAMAVLCVVEAGSNEPLREILAAAQ